MQHGKWIRGRKTHGIKTNSGAIASIQVRDSDALIPALTVKMENSKDI